MRIPQAEYDRLALHLGAIANADDFQVAGPPVGDALDGVVDQGARQAMDSGLRVVLADGDDVPVFLLHLDSGRQRRVQFALGALDQNGVAFNFDRHPFGDRNRLFSNSRHKLSALLYRDVAGNVSLSPTAEMLPTKT